MSRKLLLDSMALKRTLADVVLLAKSTVPIVDTRFLSFDGVGIPAVIKQLGFAADGTVLHNLEPQWWRLLVDMLGMNG